MQKFHVEMVNVGLKMTEFATTYHQKEKPGALITCDKLLCFWFCDDFLKQLGCESKTCDFHRTGMKNHTLLEELAEVEKKYSPGAEI